jgi:hypothetical protein
MRPFSSSVGERKIMNHSAVKFVSRSNRNSGSRDFGEKLGRTPDFRSRNEGEGRLFYPKSTRNPTEDRFLTATVKLWLESRVEPNAYPLVTI